MHNFNQSINFFYQHSQRECAQMGLRSHARCHPYLIPPPVKADHTTGVYDPYSFIILIILRPTRASVKAL